MAASNFADALKHGGGEMVQVLGEVAKEVEELRREVRALSDKMRAAH